MIAIVSLAMAPKTGYAIERIYADEAIARAGNADPVNISLEDDQVLVFSDRDNAKYVLNGRSLHINAKQVEVVGNVVIKMFASGPVAATGNAGATGSNAVVRTTYPGDGQNGKEGYRGRPGRVGDPGKIGDSAKTIILDIRNIEVNGGLLTIENEGQKGGTGGRGGTGGTGGRGGPGGNGDKNWLGFCVIDKGDGGTGGRGGTGGVGGPGGKGGNGGAISYRMPLQITIDRGLIKLSSTGGAGGIGGLPGRGGTGGVGGPPGGGCGSAGPGRRGLRGSLSRGSSTTGSTGNDGAVSSF